MTFAALKMGQRVSAEIEGASPPSLRANKLNLLERFADDLAHEIKNPLHSMVINLEVLKRRIVREGGSPPDELMRYTDVLSSELERVNRRIELLLRLVRPERTAEMTSIPEAVDELIELLELERDRRRVQIRFEPAPIPVRGHIPRDSARQIVLNLVLFGLDLIAPGGTLELRTEVEPGWIRLSLEGHGERIPLTPGHDPDSATHLSVARTIVESSGGHLELIDHGDPLQLIVSLPLTPR
jgi:signal transduction histidine kinase